MTGKLERWFRLSEHGSDVRTEVTSGGAGVRRQVHLAVTSRRVNTLALIFLDP